VVAVSLKKKKKKKKQQKTNKKQKQKKRKNENQQFLLNETKRNENTPEKQKRRLFTHRCGEERSCSLSLTLVLTSNNINRYQFTLVHNQTFLFFSHTILRLSVRFDFVNLSIGLPSGYKV